MRSEAGAIPYRPVGRNEMNEIHAKSESASQRLLALGLEFPAVGESSKYANHRTVDSSVYVAGQLPYKDGELLGQGILGRDAGVRSAVGCRRRGQRLARRRARRERTARAHRHRRRQSAAEQSGRDPNGVHHRLEGSAACTDCME